MLAHHPYREFLSQVEKPARYIGGEYNSIVKNWDEVKVKMALCFPDIYDIGMSHLGTKILYRLINGEKDFCAERFFCPWPDMEAKLREHRIPLLSLENYKPLNQFDIVGFSLQYELTFTNILTMLDLGGVPIRAKDRKDSDPIVIAGGPVATQPEPMSPFIDYFWIGDGEKYLVELMRLYERLKGEGKSRREILEAFATELGGYVPALYERELEEKTGMMVVKPSEKYPYPIERKIVEDLNEYPFPDDSPVPIAEAIFDRMSIEIARGCTEGCRFCQAGMIYRPVRERDPDQVIEKVLKALEKGGYDEAAITSLSTADYSCISPLVKKLMAKLREKKIGLGISSLRAYGLDEELLDEIDSVRASGLTFAPEAGTQRMRDVINKNITEEDILKTSHRTFSRGWRKIKLYFMIGLPTETDEDVIGIAKLGRKIREIGRNYKGKKAEVVVSVSSHVPKPHTPFQWFGMDPPERLREKQELLFKLAKKWGFTFRRHDVRISYLEGILARGDFRIADLIQDAWENGARFDGWEEHLKWEVWLKAIERWEKKYNTSVEIFLKELPLDARLPWDHIDVGVEKKFLLKEYRRAVAAKASPPCGKTVGKKVHHTTLEDALEDQKRLVCYHCGVECDLKEMREERLEFLKKLGATREAQKKHRQTEYISTMKRFRAGKTPHDFKQGKAYKFRLRYTKLWPFNLQSHQDLLRILPQVFRRANLPLYYSEGFKPKPILSFGPALPLGMFSLGEYVDVTLTAPLSPQEILAAVEDKVPQGLKFTGCSRLKEGSPKLTKAIKATEYAIIPDEWQSLEESELEFLRETCKNFMEQTSYPIEIERRERFRKVDARESVLLLDIVPTSSLPAELNLSSSGWALRVLFHHRDGLSIRPTELLWHLFGTRADYFQCVRIGCWKPQKGGLLQDPLENGAEDAVFYWKDSPVVTGHWGGDIVPRGIGYAVPQPPSESPEPTESSEAPAQASEFQLAGESPQPPAEGERGEI